MKHLITTELKQKQTISPQVYQSLRILQMNRAELEEYLKEELLENPVLEQDESSYLDGIGDSLDGMAEPAGSGMLWEEGDGIQTDENRVPVEQRVQERAETLREYIVSQFDPSLYESEYRLLDAVLDFMDSTGYLTADEQDIAAATGFSAELIGYGIKYLQRLDPLGICARNLTECLNIQLEHLGYQDKELYQITANHLEDMAAGHYHKISKGIGCPVKKVREACDVIKSLSPKPGASFGRAEIPVGIPDIIVTIEEGRPVARMEERGGMNLRLSSYYERLAKQDTSREAVEYLEKKLAHAKWVLKAIESRTATLQNVVGMMLEQQSEFFTERTGKLRPLNFRTVAQALEIHESTVSRAVNGKYLQCRKGTFPLKQFFAVKAGEQQGEDMSRNTVMERIKELIAQEDTQKPLSDNKITEILAQEGIQLSRRVIAKYRGELGIPSTAVRRSSKSR